MKKVFPTFLRRTELNALTMRTLAAPVMKVTIEERKKHHHFLSSRHLVSNASAILISWVLINHNSEHIRYSDFSTPSSLVDVSLNWRKSETVTVCDNFLNCGSIVQLFMHQGGVPSNNCLIISTLSVSRGSLITVNASRFNHFNTLSIFHCLLF